MSATSQASSEGQRATRTDTILVVEDDRNVRALIRDVLVRSGYEVLEAGTCEAAERMLRDRAPDAGILDHQLPDGSSLELLPRLRSIVPAWPATVLTGHGTIELAVRAMQLGAEQFLTKPVALDSLLASVEMMLERERRRANEPGSAPDPREPDPFAGTSRAIRRLEREARRILGSDRPLLILGETGTGKGVLASWIHRHGPRASEPFVDINCPGLSREMLESELFGFEKGAFTGAERSKPGLFEVAGRGVLFMDEIGELDPIIQGKLLKALDEFRFRRLGSVREHRVHSRLITATHRDLAADVAKGRFRADLYYRLSVFEVSIPPLRARPEDIPTIAERLLAGFAPGPGGDPLRLAPGARAALLRHSWPGNVRELKHVLERAAIQARGTELGEQDLVSIVPAVSAGASPPRPEPALPSLEDLEQQHIRAVLEAEGGHIGRAAARLGIGRSTLYQKLRSLGPPRPRR